MIRFSGALCTLCSMYCLMEAIGNPTPAPTSRPPAGQEASVSYKVSTSALFGLFYMVFIIALGEKFRSSCVPAFRCYTSVMFLYYRRRGSFTLFLLHSKSPSVCQVQTK